MVERSIFGRSTGWWWAKEGLLWCLHHGVDRYDSLTEQFQWLYAQFLQNLDQSDIYSWGSTILTCLYRDLYWAALVDFTSISGPLILLQMWAWTRFLIRQPQNKPDFHVPNLDGLDCEKKHTFGIRWCGPLRYTDNPKGKLSISRKMIEDLVDSDIV